MKTVFSVLVLVLHLGLLLNLAGKINTEVDWHQKIVSFVQIIHDRAGYQNSLKFVGRVLEVADITQT